MTNYWIIIAPKNHVLKGVAEGFAETGYGKAHPLRRMKVGDGLICYSPKFEQGKQEACQKFTAIGCVIGNDIYQADNGNQKPYRRSVKYLNSRDTAIAPLVGRLSFIKEKQRWGSVFRFGIIRIPAEDFKLIATTMNATMSVV